MSEGKLPYVHVPLPHIEQERQCTIHGFALRTHCKKCQKLICVKCIQTAHSSHDIEDWKPSNHVEAALRLIEGAFERIKVQKEKIESAAKSLDSDFRKLLEFKEKRKTMIDEERKHVERAMKDLTDLKTKLTRKEKDESSVESSVEEILGIAHESKGELHEIEIRINCLAPKAIEYSDYLMGQSSQLNSTTRGAQVRVPTRSSMISFESGFALQAELNLKRKLYIGALHAQQNNRAWCRQHYNRTLYELDAEGKVCREVDFKDPSTGDFAVLNQKIIYCNFQRKFIAIAFAPYSQKQHFQEKLLTNPAIPLGICAVKSGRDTYDIYIGFTDNFEPTLASEGSRYIGYFTLKDNDLADTRKRYIKFGEKDFLKYPYRISYNYVNNSLCVVDHTSRSSGRVVILDRANLGKVIGTYDGQDIDSKKVFDPKDICCNSKGQIIVSDQITCDIHILDKVGNFRRYIMGNDSRDVPRSVSVTDELLWIGCDNGKILVLNKQM